jgi:competence protein ComEC
MLDRPALTMRNVALAALAILIVVPESVFDASFEMSFAAVVGLVAHMNGSLRANAAVSSM